VAGNNESTDVCEACGAPGPLSYLNGEALCDRCLDERVAARTGLPRLPDPPPAEVLAGPDGSPHSFRFRLWRAPTGVLAEAQETGLGAGEGFVVKLFGDHDVDVDELVGHLRERLAAAVSGVHLERDPHRDGWIASGKEIAGRLTYNQDGAAGMPYDVVVDGRRLTWADLGHALEPFEGWAFRLVIEPMEVMHDDGHAALAEVVPLRREEAGIPVDDEIDPAETWEFDADEEEFLQALGEEEAEAVDLLREALSSLAGTNPPAGALDAAAKSLRAGMLEDRWPCNHMRRAAGFKRRALPQNDRDLWIGAVGGLISMREESGLEVEEEATIMALELADWLGAVVGLVRAGPGAPAEPEDLLRYISACPEIDVETDAEFDIDEESITATGFELVLPAWEAAGAIDSHRRLTPLGRWGLPRALAWAWNGDFDAPEGDGS
jgi:hypothetical protein